MSRSLYEIQYDLEETKDGEDGRYGRGAVYGICLDKLIEDVREAEDSFSEWSADYALIKKERDVLKAELTKYQEAVKVQSAEITTRDGATRKASIGQVVLCKCAKYGGAWTTAIIQEVYGYPPGKVGVRLLGRTPQQDSFEIANYDVHGYHAGPTWKWLDE